MEHYVNFKEELQQRTAYAEEVIRKWLPVEEGFALTMAQAMNYSMCAGGKRLRPILLLETFRLFGGEGDVAEPFMAGIEMIHTHSLIHDDLPAIDNDDYRRGRLTTHKVYGEAMGVLSGVSLLNYAYETMLQCFFHDGRQYTCDPCASDHGGSDRHLRYAWRSECRRGKRRQTDR